MLVWPRTPDPGGQGVAVSEESTTTRIVLGNRALSLAVPTSLGPPQTAGLASSCATEVVSWRDIPTGSRDGKPLLRVASMGLDSAGAPRAGCPGERPLNGSFPGWGSVAELPSGVQRLPVVVSGSPVKAAYRFQMTYNQCTNECYQRVYTVTFVEFTESATAPIWVQSWGIDDARLDAMLASLRLA